jgi:sucrose phosphorylase
MTLSSTQHLSDLLISIYGDDALKGAILSRIESVSSRLNYVAQPWSNDDVVLITYGDSITSPARPPLSCLTGFVQRYLRDAFSAVHVLPFFPFSSDDGFSVIDYYQVNYQLGDWAAMADLRREKELMFDLVMNHASRQSLWFIDFINGEGEGKDFFIEADPTLDYNQVTRPRTSPLIVDVYTRQGVKHVWATFSDDQIDVNFANPDLLLAFVDILLCYIEKGARYIRLDAVAFAWKELGTSCIHLPQTHALVKVLRWVMDKLDPNLVLITETNVPHHENISYFGQGDEAHLVYQFALPPLLLHALNRGNSSYLSHWAGQLESLPAGCSYFNFVASHDGIGVRAVEQLIPPHEMDDLIRSVHDFGGFVSMKSNPDGTKSPYELNISLFDALVGTRSGSDTWQVERYLCCQLVMLAMQGIPGVYIHSLTATPNDRALVEQTGRTRSINRHRWDLDNFEALLENTHSPQARVFPRLLGLIALRRRISAFHPEAPQQVIMLGDALFGLRRTSLDGEIQLVAIYNVTRFNQTLELAGLLRPKVSKQWDLISGQWFERDKAVDLEPYQVLWLVDQPMA